MLQGSAYSIREQRDARLSRLLPRHFHFVRCDHIPHVGPAYGEKWYHIGSHRRVLEALVRQHRRETAIALGNAWVAFLHAGPNGCIVFCCTWGKHRSLALMFLFNGILARLGIGHCIVTHALCSTDWRKCGLAGVCDECRQEHIDLIELAFEMLVEMHIHNHMIAF